MIYTVNHSPLYCYTGGKAFDPAQPTAVFIHGVAGDHSVWALQSRSLAHHGWNVLAIDRPAMAAAVATHPKACKKPPKRCVPCSMPWAHTRLRSSATAGVR